ncbi:hypothetical protein P700755_002686 [Psychroflexus torquis ATCC 700755]|uniref:Uncharacterized protein n=1 Tax=Psychroflexus torquis (strain ATCC 700755 / CIP 106069 / ACAM 623) TaxID=313595 RepID=K4IFW7_PSYTT|nr:hypothetical protein [Psychroflexus torquis]AFU69427.1 hypothetical protein P700755_002686 [Psychroflexus torquis ATCC 700755]
MKRQLFFGHLLTLFIGGLIYVAFRTDSLLMFKWFSAASIDTPIELIRGMTLTAKNSLPDWFLFSLPDGLWIFSYTSLVLLIWRNKINRENFFWIAIIPILIILSELGQLFNIVPGTFDLIDVLLYSLGAILPILIFTEYLNFKTETI